MIDSSSDISLFPKLEINDFPEWGLPLLVKDHIRYKIYYGGRGSAKSWTAADAAIIRAHTGKEFIACFREVQSSMRDSIHALLKRTIYRRGLQDWFDIQDTKIRGRANGSEFIFRGFRNALDSIRSIEGITIALIEEAETVSDKSWETLIPTVRAPGSEIWVVFNPKGKDSPTRKRMVLDDPFPGRSFRKHVNYDSNPWFPPDLDAERLHMLRTDPQAYKHVWLGEPEEISEAVIFKGKTLIEPFEIPEGISFNYGADWGFSQDPSCLVKDFVNNGRLFVCGEAYRVGVELEDIGPLFRTVPGADKGLIYADNSRPETISYVRRNAGLNIRPADKWPGSVEDGIAHLRAFEQIVIHPGLCPRTADEATLYSYKLDKFERPTTDIVDAHNHCIDSLRYSLNDYIQRRGAAAVWLKLGK